MTVDEIVNLVVAALPSIIAFFTTIGMIIKTIKEFKSMKKEVTNMKAIEDVRDQLGAVLKENYELKTTLNETMTKIDHIEHK